MSEQSFDEFLDGFALWEEHKPQSGEDWLGIARRVLADGGADNPSPIFAGLLLAQAEADHYRAALERIRDHGETHDEPCYALHNGDCADAMQEIARAALSDPATPSTQDDQEESK